MRLPLTLALVLLAGCPNRSWRAAPTEALSEAKALFNEAPAFLFATAKVTYFGDQGRLKGELGLVLSRPDRLYIELRGPGGTPLSIFACDGDTARLFEVEGPRFFEGPADASSLGRVLPVALNPKLAVSLLLGSPPLPPKPVVERSGDRLRISGVHPELGPLALTLDEGRWRWELTGSKVRIDLSDRRQGVFHRLLIRAGDEEVAWQLSELELGGDAPALTLFKVERPAGLTPSPF